MLEIRSSSLPRVMTCTGSLTFSDLKQEETDHAKEGTAFHEFVQLLHSGKNPGEVASNGVVYDADMHHYAGLVLPIIPPDAKAEPEIRYELANAVITGHLDYTWEEQDTLVVMDIKYGHRVVEVENNWQLISYAIGQMIKSQKNYKDVKLMIVQPRPHHYKGWVRSWTITVAELFEFYKKIQEVTDRVAEGKVSFVTSDKCKYCPAVGKECSALNNAFYNAIDVVINDHVRDDLTNVELASMLYNYERIKDVFKIKMDAISDLAKSKIRSGETINGYSLAPQLGNRKWSKDFNADNFFALTGIDLKKTELLSPAEAEKKKVPAELVESFCVREDKGFKLVPVDELEMVNELFKQ